MSNIAAGKELDDEGEKLNDVEESLNRVGIKLRENETDWRNFYSVLDEIASKWEGFTDTEKSQITTALGGTRQRENVLTMLENWDKVKEYADIGANANGTAMEKYGIVLESVSAKQEQLTAKSQEFYGSILNSGFIATLLDIAKVLMDIMNIGDGLIGKITLIIAAFTALNFIKTTSVLSGIKTLFIELGSALYATATGAFTLNASFLNLGTSGIGALLLSIPKAIIGLISLTAQFGFAEVAALGLKGALDLLNINPVMLALSALIAVVVGGFALFNALNVTLEEQHEKAKQAQQDYIELKNELQSVNEELETTQQRIDELNNKDKLTLTEQDELEKLKAQNAELEKRAYWIDREAKKKQEEATKEATEAWNKDFEEGSLFGGQYEYRSRYRQEYDPISQQYTAAYITESEYLQEMLRYYNELDSQITNLSKKQGQWTEEEKNQYYDLIEERNKTKSWLESEGIKIQTDYIDAYPDVDPAVMQGWKDLRQTIYDCLNPKSDGAKLDDLINKQTKEWTTYYTQLAKSGKLTIDSFSEGFKQSVKEALNLGENDVSGLNEALESIITYFNGLIYNSDKTKDSFSEVMGGVTDLSKSYDLLQKAQKEANENGSISIDTLNKISEAYPQLEESVALYCAGIITEKELIAELSDAYNTDEQNYEELIHKKILLSPKFYQGLSDAQKQNIKMLFESYETDFQNFKSAEEAKLNFNAQIISKLAERWSHYNGKSLEYLKTMKSAMESDARKFGVPLGDEYKDISKAISDMEGFQKSLDSIVLDGVDYSPKNFKNSSSSGSSSTTNKVLSNMKKQVESLESPIKVLDNQIKELGNIDTIDEYNKQLDLVNQKSVLISKNITQIQNLIKKTKDKETLQYLKEKLSSYKADLANIKDTIDNIRLNKLKLQLEDLEKPIKDVDDAIKRIGNINTVEEKEKEASLLAEKFRLISSNIKTINELLKDTTLSKDMRELLEKELQDLLVDRVGIRDSIESNIRESVELEKKNAQLQAELDYKQKLYDIETALYGNDGKDAWEHLQEERIAAIQKEIDARNEEKEAQEKITEEQEIQNKLLEAKISLQNALNNKTVKILTKQDDGTWQYEYSANMADVKSATDNLKNAQKEYDDWKKEQDVQKLQDEINALNKEKEEKSNTYSDNEFHLKQSLEAQTNSIEEYYDDIDKITQKRMADYQKIYGDEWDKVIGIAQQKVAKLSALNTELTAKSQYAFETVGTDNTYVKKIQSFGIGGTIRGSGLAFVHDKERVLTSQQNSLFEKVVSKLPNLLKISDMFRRTDVVNSRISGVNNNNNTSSDKITINKVECVFPNATNSTEIQKAILGLPRLAIQK